MKCYFCGRTDSDLKQYTPVDEKDQLAQQIALLQNRIVVLESRLKSFGIDVEDKNGNDINSNNVDNGDNGNNTNNKHIYVTTASKL